MKYLWMVFLVAAWMQACGDGSKSSTDGNTSWLGTCDVTRDCVADLQCLCGICTRPCTSAGACKDLDEHAVCGVPASCPGEPSGGNVCLGAEDGGPASTTDGGDASAAVADAGADAADADADSTA